MFESDASGLSDMYATTDTICVPRGLRYRRCFIELYAFMKSVASIIQAKWNLCLESRQSRRIIEASISLVLWSRNKKS